jgi:hypothetical protein
MEKELKIAELANVWGVSVPTTWNRIKKMGLITFIKKNESNKDVNYVRISDEQINEYVIKVINKDNNLNNNGYYEDMLIDNNVNNVVNNLNNGENVHKNSTSQNDIIQSLTTINNDYNDRLITVINDYNNRLKLVNDELIEVKSKGLLLEDKAGREGFYLNEINGLKKDVKQKEIWIKGLITVIVILLLGLTGYITYNVAVNSIKKTEQVKEVKTPPAPVQVKK